MMQPTPSEIKKFLEVCDTLSEFEAHHRFVRGCGAFDPRNQELPFPEVLAVLEWLKSIAANPNYRTTELAVAKSRELFLRGELNEAGQQFLHYARLHLSKSPPDVKKARVNTQWAERCMLGAGAKIGEEKATGEICGVDNSVGTVDRSGADVA